MTALIDSDLLVHIGLHKTATSWLQENLFTRTELGFYGPAESKKRRALVKNVGHFLVADESEHLINEWEFDAGAVRASLANLEAREGIWPVVSYERLSGHPLSNGFDRQMICHRIKAVFPKARILICIREQGAIILSNYMQYLRNGGWNTPEAFLNHRPDGRQPTTTLKFWEYHTLVSMYYNVFGRNSVLVLPYELFAREPHSYIRQISDFVGLPTPNDLPVKQIVKSQTGACQQLLFPPAHSPGTEHISEWALSVVEDRKGPQPLRQEFFGQGRAEVVGGEHQKKSRASCGAMRRRPLPGKQQSDAAANRP